MKWKGRSQSSNLEDRRKKGNAFSPVGRLNWVAVQDKYVDRVAAKKAHKRKVRTSRTNGR